MRVISFLFVICFSFHALSLTNQRSIDWQKVDLQGVITERVDQKAKALLGDSGYLVDVKIAVAQPSRPAFAQARDEEDEEEGGKQEPNQKKKKLNRNNKYLIKNYSKDDLPKDSIVFSKFGLVAPVVDELMLKNEAPPVINLPKNEKENEQGINFDDVWKFNKNSDLFENLESIEVNVTVDEGVDQGLVSALQKTIGDMDITYNGVKAKVDVKTATLNYHQETMSDILVRLLKEFHQGLLIFLSLLAVYFISLLANKKGSAQAGDKAAGADGQKSENINQKLNVSKEDEEGEASNLANGNEQSGEGSGAKIYDGMERLRSVLISNKEIVLELLEGWISSKDDESRLKLNAVVNQLKTEELGLVLKSFDQKKREELKNLLGYKATPKEFEQANLMILDEILDRMILPKRRISQEVFDQIAAMSPENTAIFMKDHAHLSSILFYEMKTDFITSAISHLESEFREELLGKSVNFEPLENEELYVEFLQKIPKYFDEKKIYPGLLRAKEIIYSADSKTEESLYKALLTSTDSVIVEKMLLDKFPAFLMPQMEDDFIKEVISIFPMNSKVPFLFAAEPSVRERFMSVYAPEGSVAADLIALEFEKYEGDEDAANEASEKIEQYWAQLLKIAQDHFKVDPKSKKMAKNIIQDWIGQNSSKDKKTDLKLAV